MGKCRHYVGKSITEIWRWGFPDSSSLRKAVYQLRHIKSPLWPVRTLNKHKTKICGPITFWIEDTLKASQMFSQQGPKATAQEQVGSAFSQEVVSPNCIASLGKGKVALWQVTVPMGRLCGQHAHCPLTQLLLNSMYFWNILRLLSHSLSPHLHTLSVRIRDQQPEIKIMIIVLLLLLLLIPYKFHLQTLKTPTRNLRSPNQSNRWSRKCAVKHCHRATHPSG